MTTFLAAIAISGAMAHPQSGVQDFLNWPRIDLAKNDPYNPRETRPIYVSDINKARGATADKVNVTIFLTESIGEQLMGYGLPVSAQIILYFHDSRYDPESDPETRITSRNYRSLVSSTKSIPVSLKPEYREMDAELIYRSNRSMEFFAKGVRITVPSGKILGFLGDVKVKFDSGRTWTAHGALVGEHQ